MKRVLVISYYWPPAGGVSVLRSLKIVKYLRNYGWEPVVYVPANASYDYHDPSNQKDVPPDLEIIKGTILEPFNIFRKISGRKKNEPLENLQKVQKTGFSLIDQLGLWIRGNFFIPDARSLWVKPSVRLLTKYLSEKPVDAIFTDGPPHTNTVIGYYLSKKFNIPWLADFQDPWTQVDYLQDFPLTKWAWDRHKKLEQFVFKEASKITIASPTWKKDLELIGASNVEVLYYGYDEDDFTGLKPQRSDQEFVIFHGGLLGYDRFPKLFFELLADLYKGDQTWSNLKLKFAGKVDYRIVEFIQTMGLEAITDYKGFIPRNEVLQNELNANLLLLPLNKAQNAKGRLPGKLYEYMRSGTPILGFGPTDSDASKILSETMTGVVANYDDPIRIKDYLNKVKRNLTSTPEVKNIMEYSNDSQVKVLSIYLNNMMKK